MLGGYCYSSVVSEPALLRFATEAAYHSSSISNFEENDRPVHYHVVVATTSQWCRSRQIIFHP